MRRILMVCLGNICRSPLAEGILKSKVDPTKVVVDSAGTSNYHIGKTPDSRSIEVAAKYHIDISKQRARQFTSKDFDDFDNIFAMDTSNFDDIISKSRNKSDRQKVKLMLSVLDSGMLKEVPDPYYGENDGFEKVFKLLDQATDKVVEDL